VREPLTGRLLREAARSRKRRALAGAILRAAAPVLPRKPPPKEPIVILGSPRSGTTLVFEVLGSSPRLASLEAESHLLWEMYHDLPSSGWTHALDASELSANERRVLYWEIDRIAAGGRRYLDKAPRNCLRVPYLYELFPGAWFVFVKRDGRAAVSSLLTGWRAEGNMFPGMVMPGALSIDGYDGDTWKFLVPRGWEAYATGHTLAEVCAFQWVAANEALLEARDRLGIERWVEVSYEDFVDAPGEQVTALLEAIGLPPSAEVLEHAGTLDRRVTKAITPPRKDKWRTENPAEIESILATIAPLMRRLGYAVEDVTPSG
jgi:hypothetical protein